ncbi:hypothetical protein [Kitasatospora aureofaciens]|uniref:hypothetical protein n=1 Tax=Kitasatospora aureofaciens TaxID=1894 RepID=UPI003804355C
MTLALLGLYLAVVGFALPRRLAGSPRLQAHPAAGAALWLALMASFLVALLLAAHHATGPFAHEPAGLVGLIPHAEPAVPLAPHTHDWWLLTAAAAGLGAVVAAVGVRAGRMRRRHRAVLDLVAVRDRQWDALVLEHAHPTVYCLPGRRSRVVVSRGRSTCSTSVSSPPPWRTSASTSAAGTTCSGCRRTPSHSFSADCRSPAGGGRRWRCCWRWRPTTRR